MQGVREVLSPPLVQGAPTPFRASALRSVRSSLHLVLPFPWALWVPLGCAWALLPGFSSGGSGGLNYEERYIKLLEGNLEEVKAEVERLKKENKELIETIKTALREKEHN